MNKMLVGMEEVGMDTKNASRIKTYYFGKSWKTEAQIRAKMRWVAKQETVKENSNPSPISKVGFPIIIDS